MSTFVALLRAVNLGSHQQIAMSALRDFAKDLGLVDIRTHRQSGNLVFGAERQDREKFGKSPGRQREKSTPTRHRFLRSLSKGVEGVSREESFS